jgi:PKD repeat protein
MKSIYNLRVGKMSDQHAVSRSYRKLSTFLLSGLFLFLINLQSVNAQYCASSSSSSFDEVISNVTIGSLNNTSVCGTVAPGPGSVVNQYSNFTTLAAPSLTVGVTYPASVSVNTCNGYYGTYVTTYIDWNGDQDFLDAGETVYTSASIPGAATLTYNVTVPPGAVPGLTRMRVVHVEYAIPSSCGTYSYGETEDYNINIVASSACSGTPTGGTAITSNASPCPSTSYTVSLSGASTSSGITYQWQSSPNNTTFTNITGATSSFYNTTASTTLYYRCVLTCAASSLTSTSSSVLVAVSSFINCYCTSNATSTFDEEILNVSLGSMSNSSSCGTTGGPGSINSQYSNFTNATPAVAIPNLTQGFVYPLSVGIGTCNGNYSNWTKVWIDYNQNGLFTDPGEMVYSSPTFTQGPHTETANITIPLTAAVGNTRMRVVNVETSSAAGVNPCGTYSWGETEDYFVNIAVPLANDAGIVNFVNPVVPTCVFNDSVSVTLKNYGTDTLTSVNINWSKNAINLTPLFWTGSLAPLTDTTVFVGTTVYVAGDDLCAWTSNPNGVIENPAGSYNDSSCIFGLSTGLSGLYTIGGTTPDFTDFPAAIAALNAVGVCGPTIFDVRTGTYFDQFELINVIGMNATNTVTFRSETGNRNDVTVNYGTAGPTNNYIVKMNNADYFRIESMTLVNPGATYGRVFDIQGGSEHNTIFNCNIQTQAASSTSNFIAPIFSGGSNDNYNTFEGNSIIGGSYGAYWYGGGVTSLEVGSVFKNNEFVDNYYSGLFMYYQNATEVTGNRIYGVSSYTFRYGIYGYYVDKASKFTHNSIESNPTSFWYYGMYLGNMDATATGRGLISNNAISVGIPGSTSGVYGIYMSNSGFFDIYNNSVNIAGGSNFSYTFYISGGGANNVKNNTFTNFGTGYAAYVIGAYAINEMNYNNLRSSGANVGYYDGTVCSTFTNWKNTSGYDANGINVNPSFYSNFDLHVCADSLNNKGVTLALVTDDIDGQPRNATTPDIGSDEFAPLTSPGFVGPDALVCTGQTVNLYAGAPADQILWSTGDTTNTLVVTTPGTYTVTVISTCGTAFDTVVVTASALTYTGFLNASQTVFCSGGSALLTSTMPASTYSWTGGSTNDSLVVTASNTYTLNITDACGSGSESVAITVNTVPVASFTTTPSYFAGAFTNTSTGGGATTYLWNFGDGNTSTDVSPSHIYSTVGTFTVTLTVTNACGTSTATSTITTSPVGLEEVDGLGTIAVYPNPSNGLFNIDFNMNNDANIEIQVTNLLGESVLVRNLGSINGNHKDAIDITSAAPGVYYVTVISDDKIVMTNKLVKQ